MSTADYPRFLSECIIHNPDEQPGLREDDVYGVYLSWCLLNQKQPAPEQEFWAAMGTSGYDRANDSSGRYVCPGLGMKGPAAADYILSSQPSIV